MENPITLQELQALSKTLEDLEARGLITGGMSHRMNISTEADFIRLTVGCPVTVNVHPKMSSGGMSPYIHYIGTVGELTLIWLQEGGKQ